MKRSFHPELIGAILVISLATFLTFFLRVQTITCVTTSNDFCPNEKDLEEVKNERLFFSDFMANEVILAYAAKHDLRFSTYQLRLPNTLQLSFEENPMAYQVESDTQERFAVSQIGTAKPLHDLEPDTNKLVIVQIPETYLQANTLVLPENLHLFLLELTTAEYARLNKMLVVVPKSDFIELQIDSGMRAFLPYEQPKQKLKQLQQIVLSESLTELTEPVREIDLRFDLPVLRTQQ
ncbi:MAG: hypothetical protein O2840_01400 [bacterium]|nr:hypothetical protein [bacterium]